MSDIAFTNADLWNALVHPVDPTKPGPLTELVACDTILPASNYLRRSLRLAQAEFATLDAERNKLVELYVTNTKNEAGEAVQTIAPEFGAEFTKLMAVPVTLPGAVAPKVSDLGPITFSGAKLEVLIQSKFLIDDTNK